MLRILPWVSLLGMMSAGAEDAVAFRKDAEAPRLRTKEVPEASGMAVSRRDPGFLWIVNDSGAGPLVHLVTKDGVDRGRITVEGVANVDWEDLAAFKSGGKSYLLIADSGDNNSVRNDCVLHVIEEPELPAGDDNLDVSVKPSWSIRFSYEGGPRDCESVAVDAAAGKVILVSKRTKPPEVYELPLRPKGGDVVVAKMTGTTSVAPPKGTPPLPYIAQPTGMDISSDGSMAAIVTYVGVFIFPRNGKESWADALARQATILAPHGMAQAESIAFTPDGRGIKLVSERGDDRIVTYQR